MAHHDSAPDEAPPLPEDLNALAPAVWPSRAGRDATGQLTLAGHGAADLVARFGSPLYLLDEAEFRDRARGFVAAFPGWSVHYASKAFLCKAVARWVEQEGLGLDVCSGNELAVALAAGFPPARIGLHGNNKSGAELSYAIEAGVGRIIVD
jgi:diaminopimelate decarboxylase